MQIGSTNPANPTIKKFTMRSDATGNTDKEHGLNKAALDHIETRIAAGVDPKAGKTGVYVAGTISVIGLLTALYTHFTKPSKTETAKIADASSATAVSGAMGRLLPVVLGMLNAAMTMNGLNKITMQQLVAYIQANPGMLQEAGQPAATTPTDPAAPVAQPVGGQPTSATPAPQPASGAAAGQPSTPTPATA